MKKLLFSTRTVTFVIGLLSMVMFNSCSRIFYVPNAQNVTMFKEKHELKTYTALTWGDSYRAAEFQTAYAITDHVGVMANASWVHGDSPYVRETEGRIGEIGAGYFKTLKKHWIAECYGGIGIGKYNHVYQYYTNNWVVSDAVFSYTRGFIQPAIGFTSSIIDISASVRVNALHFNSPKVNDYYKMETLQNDAQMIDNLGLILQLEPCLTARAGWKNVKLQAQLVMSGSNNQNFSQAAYNFNTGVVFTLPYPNKALE